MQQHQDAFLFKQGWLTLRKGLLNFQRFVTLCAPATIQDVQKVYEHCFQNDPYAPIKHKSIPWLGHVTRASAKGTPLLIISSQEVSEDPIFIHLDQSMSIKDESMIRKACHFELLLSNNSIPFACSTSVDYQDWMDALHLACDLAHLSHQPFQPQLLDPWLRQVPDGQSESGTRM
jgi:hypothetical protein